jgi:uncharacterized membrane protein (DUF441 family)
VSNILSWFNAHKSDIALVVTAVLAVLANNGVQVPAYVTEIIAMLGIGTIPHSDGAKTARKMAAMKVVPLESDK